MSSNDKPENSTGVTRLPDIDQFMRSIPPRLRTCGNCEHFEADQTGITGMCFARPPVAFQIMVPNPKAVLAPNEPPTLPALQGVNPPTRRDRRRCGEWQTKIQGSA